MCSENSRTFYARKKAHESQRYQSFTNLVHAPLSLFSLARAHLSIAKNIYLFIRFQIWVPPVSSPESAAQISSSAQSSISSQYSLSNNKNVGPSFPLLPRTRLNAVSSITLIAVTLTTVFSRLTDPGHPDVGPAVVMAAVY